MRVPALIAALLCALPCALFCPFPGWGATRLELEARLIEAPQGQLRGLSAEALPDGRLRLRLGRSQLRALPFALQSAELSCRLARAGTRLRCGDGQLRLDAAGTGRLRGRFSLDYGDARDWSLRFSALRGQLSAQDRAERYVAQKLELDAEGEVQRRGGALTGALRLRLPAGEGFVEPLYVDFGKTPLRAAAQWRLHLASRLLMLSDLDLQFEGIGQASGHATVTLSQPRQTLAASLQLRQLALAPFAERLLLPFLAGTRFDTLGADGRGEADIELQAGAPTAVRLQLQDAQLVLPKLGLVWSGVDGTARWTASGSAPESTLHWRELQLGQIEVAPGTLRFAADARDFRLLEPLRLAMLGGALQLRQLQLRELGRPAMSAAFDAELEPIDLAALCRALGWPEFSGTLAGRLPGLRLEGEQLSLDGRLEARAFDGEIALSNLRAIQPFGVLPRVAADLRLRRLDLKAVTGAFSFGRIEGRLDGDISGLRLLRWKPVAMDARLYTTPGDTSRHRISQRAIDNISSVGGGPSGVLSRSFLRVFDDFAYDRIGWSCRLVDGICHMGGIEPAENGGYVLVKGKLLPRIQVVGYSRRVGWETFLGQLRAALDAEKAEIR